MKRKFILLMVLLVCPVSHLALMGQKVYKDASNRIILDLTEVGIGTGLNPGSITNASKTAVYDLYPPLIYTESVPTGENRLNGSLNEKVFQKLEIAPADMSGGAGMQLYMDKAQEMSWMHHYENCRQLNHNGTAWRLPTLRELVLIATFRPAIDALSSRPMLGTTYWSTTEEGVTGPYSYVPGAPSSVVYKIAIHGQQLSTVTVSKADSSGTLYAQARCVREVTP